MKRTTDGSPSPSIKPCGVSSAMTLPVVDDGDAVTEVLCLVHEVRHEHDRGAILPDLSDQIPCRSSRLGIQPLSELVEEDQLGGVDERQRDEEPLALTPRQAVEGLISLLLQPPSSEELIAVDRAAGERREQFQGLGDSEPAGQRRILQL